MASFRGERAADGDIRAGERLLRGERIEEGERSGEFMVAQSSHSVQASFPFVVVEAHELTQLKMLHQRIKCQLSS